MVTRSLASLFALVSLGRLVVSASPHSRKLIATLAPGLGPPQKRQLDVRAPGIAVLNQQFSTPITPHGYARVQQIETRRDRFARRLNPFS